MSIHAVAHLDELPRIPAGGPDDAAWTPIRHALGVGAFGVNAWHADAGGVVIEEHDEVPDNSCGCAGHEELYLVLDGHAVFTVDGDDVDAPRGTVVVLPPNLRRKAVAKRDGTTVLAIGGPRGDVYHPGAWERRAVTAAGLA
jgi:quercetin dioxygenase-like cupin family protein